MPFITVRQDITLMEVDAIVNPANNNLYPGGGCSGAIHAAAGPRLEEECRKIGSCPTGEARITGAYDLPAKYVIHTVGPVWRGGAEGERQLLVNAYLSSLRLAAANGCQSVAFPLISAGIYGYPVNMALEVARETISGFLMGEDDSDMTVYLVLFEKRAYTAGTQLFRDITKYIHDNSPRLKRFEASQSSRADFFSSSVHRNASRREPVIPESEPSEVYGSANILPEFSFSEAALMPDWPDELFNEVDESFSQMLIRLIDARGLKDSDVYKRANKDRKLFNKIKLNPDYHPGKQTALAFAVALELDIDTTNELLKKAGFTLTHSSRGDLIVEYCIKKRIYDIIMINQLLFDYDQQLL